MSQSKNYFNTPKYLIDPQHPITVDLIGAGGTGSHVAMGLACMTNACKALGHPGFFVTLWDDDKVESHNVGRQYFANTDIGLNKGAALISRINRMYGIRWTNQPYRYCKHRNSNIVISCVDSIKSRKEIKLNLQAMRIKNKDRHVEGYKTPYLWIDAGNSKDTGQIIISSLSGADFHIPDFFDRFPDVKDDETKQPSCSMREALLTQDLHINKQMALLVNDIIWKMLRTARIELAGLYVNHKLYQTSSIPISKTS